MRKIKLTRGKYAIVDNEDFARISSYTWCADETSSGKFYAMRKSGKKTVRMHRDVLMYSGNLDVDHIDGNGLNNQKKNLRIVSHQQNMANYPVDKKAGHHSKYRGVSFHKKAKKFNAYIRINGKDHHIGLFLTEDEAFIARNNFLKSYEKTI